MTSAIPSERNQSHNLPLSLSHQSQNCQNSAFVRKTLIGPFEAEAIEGKNVGPLLSSERMGHHEKAHLAASFFRGAGWVEPLRFLTRNVHEPRHAKFVSEHAKRITPWGFLEWHCYVAAGRKLLEIAF